MVIHFCELIYQIYTLVHIIEILVRELHDVQGQHVKIEKDFELFCQVEMHMMLEKLLEKIANEHYHKIK